MEFDDFSFLLGFYLTQIGGFANLVALRLVEVGKFQEKHFELGLGLGLGLVLGLALGLEKKFGI